MLCSFCPFPFPFVLQFLGLLFRLFLFWRCVSDLIGLYVTLPRELFPPNVCANALSSYPLLFFFYFSFFLILVVWRFVLFLFISVFFFLSHLLSDFSIFFFYSLLFLLHFLCFSCLMPLSFILGGCCLGSFSFCGVAPT